MSKINNLLNEYGESHTNHTNKLIHWICVPAIVFSLTGLIWSIPVPDIFSGLKIVGLPFNWALPVLILGLIYYITLSIPLAAGMIGVEVLLSLVCYKIDISPDLSLWKISLMIFVIAWIGQFWGHKIEGKKPSFLKDIQFLLIGPVWLLSFVYRKVGIQY